MWYQLSTADLKSDPSHIVEAYDELCDFLGTRPFRMRHPLKLVSKGHVTLFCRDGKLRGELDQKIVRELCGAGEPVFVTSGSLVEKTVGKKIRWLGKDPKGLYPRCKGWYGRRIDGGMKARAMVEFPLRVIATAQTELPERAVASRAQLKRLKNRALRF